MISAGFAPLTLDFARIILVDLCMRWFVKSEKTAGNPYIQAEIHKKCLWILLRVFELLPENARNSHSLFGFFEYDAVKEHLQGLLLEKRRGGLAISRIFREIHVEDKQLALFLASQLVSVMDKGLISWKSALVFCENAEKSEKNCNKPANNPFKLEGKLDPHDLLLAIALFQSYQPFFLTKILEKNLLGILYNKKYEGTVQKSLAFLGLGLENRESSEIAELLVAVFEEKIDIKSGFMDKIAVIACLHQRYRANIKELLEINLQKYGNSLVNFVETWVFKRKIC